MFSGFGRNRRCCSLFESFAIIIPIVFDFLRTITSIVYRFQAEDNNIVFLQVPNRRFEGKTLYTLGKTTIYIDQGVVFVQTQGLWKPISLQDLFVLAK